MATSLLTLVFGVFRRVTFILLFAERRVHKAATTVAAAEQQTPSVSQREASSPEQLELTQLPDFTHAHRGRPAAVVASAPTVVGNSDDDSKVGALFLISFLACFM